MGLQEFRDQYPQFNDMSDAELLGRIYKQKYADKVSPQEFIGTLIRKSQPNLGGYQQRLDQAKLDATQLLKSVESNQAVGDYVGWSLDQTENLISDPDDLPMNAPIKSAPTYQR